MLNDFKNEETLKLHRNSNFEMDDTNRCTNINLSEKNEAYSTFLQHNQSIKTNLVDPMIIIKNKTHSEMNISKQNLLFLTSNLFMIFLCIIPYFLQEIFNYALACDRTKNWADILYKNTTQNNCKDKCSSTQSGQLETKIARIHFHISLNLGNFFAAYLFNNLKIDVSVFFYSLSSILTTVFSFIFVNNTNVFRTIIKESINLLFIIIIFVINFKDWRKLVNLAMIILSIIGYEYFYEHFYTIHFLAGPNFFTFFLILPITTTIFSSIFGIIIGLKWAKTFHPLFKLYIGFITFAYIRGFSFGTTIYVADMYGFSWGLWFSVFFGIINDIINVRLTFQRFLYFIFNKIFKKNLNFKSGNDFSQITNSLIPYFDIFCMTSFIMTSITLTLYNNYLPIELNDCYGVVNKLYFVPNNLVLLYFLIILLIKNIFFFSVRKYILNKYLTFKERFYLPNTESYSELLIMIFLIGFSAQSFLLRGFYDGIFIKYNIDKKK